VIGSPPNTNHGPPGDARMHPGAMLTEAACGVAGKTLREVEEPGEPPTL
jgi:hypothetical protein